MSAINFDFNIDHTYPHVYDTVEIMAKNGEIVSQSQYASAWPTESFIFSCTRGGLVRREMVLFASRFIDSAVCQCTFRTIDGVSPVVMLDDAAMMTTQLYYVILLGAAVRKGWLKENDQFAALKGAIPLLNQRFVPTQGLFVFLG